MTVSIDNIHEVLILANSNPENLKELNQLERKALLSMMKALKQGTESLDLTDVRFEDIRAKLSGFKVKDSKISSFKGLKNIFAGRVSTADLRKEAKQTRKTEIERVTSLLAKRALELSHHGQELETLMMHSDEQERLKSIEHYIDKVNESLADITDADAAHAILQRSCENMLFTMRELIAVNCEELLAAEGDSPSPELIDLLYAFESTSWKMGEYDTSTISAALAPYPTIQMEFKILEKLFTGLAIRDNNIPSDPKELRSNLKQFNEKIHYHMSDLVDFKKLDPTFEAHKQKLQAKVVTDQEAIRKLESQLTYLMGAITVDQQLVRMDREHRLLEFGIHINEIVKACLNNPPDLDDSLKEHIQTFSKEAMSDPKVSLLLTKFQGDLEKFLKVPLERRARVAKQLQKRYGVDQGALSGRLDEIDNQIRCLQKEKILYSEQARFYEQLLPNHNAAQKAISKQIANLNNQKKLLQNSPKKEDIFHLQILDNVILPDLQSLQASAAHASATEKSRNLWVNHLLMNKDYWMKKGRTA